MSNGINKVTLIGNLGRDVETRQMNNGKTVANFSIAVSESWRDKQSGEKREETEWINCAAFGPLADVCSKYLGKGSKVYVEGKLKTDKYEKDGQTHYSTKIIIRDMQMLDSKGGQQSGGQQNQPPQHSSGPITNADDFVDDIPFDLYERGLLI